MQPLILPIAPIKEDYGFDLWKDFLLIVGAVLIYLICHLIMQKFFPDASENAEKSFITIVIFVVVFLIAFL